MDAYSRRGGDYRGGLIEVWELVRGCSTILGNCWAKLVVDFRFTVEGPDI